ncbi:hypothetical protein O181_043329 [Austropuccinia psidii MF-1]|uniref:Uncharacterized protein n=1 Tax=Austropuccinia psidii MF-1 TaxID=1389203 RepID=A0A9Q3DHT2_9BASI|nr:hypothetical protein [Austropuccinia psidii MF-1]
MLFQVPNTSHMVPYTGPGSQRFTGQSLRPMAHTPILMSNASQSFTCNSLCFSRFPTHHTQFLTLGRVPNASQANPYAQHFTCDSLRWSRLPIPTPKASNTIPYAFPGSQFITHNSLRWARFLTLHRPILMPDS